MSDSKVDILKKYVQEYRENNRFSWEASEYVDEQIEISILEFEYLLTLFNLAEKHELIVWTLDLVDKYPLVNESVELFERLNALRHHRNPLTKIHAWVLSKWGFVNNRKPGK